MILKGFPITAPRMKTMMTSRVEAIVTLPRSARIVHVGAVPPRGDLFVYAEVSEVMEPNREMEVVVLKSGDVVPDGYEYLGYVLAVPLLFVYERKTTIVSSVNTGAARHGSAKRKENTNGR